MQSQREIIKFGQELRGVDVTFHGPAILSAGELDQLLQARFSEGWEAGQKSLSAQLVQQRSDLLQVQNGVIASLKKAVAGVVAETEAVLAELTFTSVCRIVGQTAVTKEMVSETVTESLSGIASNCVFEIRLHPEDLQMFQDLQGDFGLSKEVLLVADNALERGDCCVRTRFGLVDARRSTKLQNLATEFSL